VFRQSSRGKAWPLECPHDAISGGGTKLERVRHDTDSARRQPRGSLFAAGESTGHRRTAVQRADSQPGVPRAGRDRLAEVGRGSTLNLAAAAVSAIATTALTVLITRQFSRPEAGAFFTATSAFLILGAVGGLGTNVGLTYFIARLRSLASEDRIPVIMRAAIVPTVIASAAAAAVLLLIAGPLAHLVLHGRAGQGGATPTEVALTLRGLALALPFAGLLNAYLGASRGYRDMRPTAMLGQIGLSVGRLLGVLVAAAAGSAALLAPLWALPYVPTAVIAWLWLRRISHSRMPRRAALSDVPPEVAALLALSTPVPSEGTANSARSRITRRQLASATPGGFWRFSIPRGIANTAQNILQQIDIVLVAVMRGPAAAAVYTAATRFLVLGQFGGMAISRAAQPRFTELFTIGDRRGTNVVYQATTAWLIVLMWPLYLLAAVFGPKLLIVFGHSYRAGADVMIILALTMLLGTACGQVDMVLVTSGRSTWSLVNGLMATGVNVGADLLLIPRYGITGAAIGWAIAIAISNLMPLAQLTATFRLHPFGRATILACALMGTAFGLIPLVIRSVLGGGVIAIVAGITIGCVVAVLGLWRFREVLRLSEMPGLAVLVHCRAGR
jgi:O-antigen/teichoic acid export membrane protein